MRPTPPDDSPSSLLTQSLRSLVPAFNRVPALVLYTQDWAERGPDVEQNPPEWLNQVLPISLIELILRDESRIRTPLSLSALRYARTMLWEAGAFTPQTSPRYTWLRLLKRLREDAREHDDGLELRRHWPFFADPWLLPAPDPGPAGPQDAPIPPLNTPSLDSLWDDRLAFLRHPEGPQTNQAPSLADILARARWHAQSLCQEPHSSAAQVRAQVDAFLNTLDALDAEDPSAWSRLLRQPRAYHVLGVTTCRSILTQQLHDQQEARTRSDVSTRHLQTSHLHPLEAGLDGFSSPIAAQTARLCAALQAQHSHAARADRTPLILELSVPCDAPPQELERRLHAHVLGYLSFLASPDASKAATEPLTLGLIGTFHPQASEATLWQQAQSLLSLLHDDPLLRAFVVGITLSGPTDGTSLRTWGVIRQLVSDYNAAHGLDQAPMSRNTLPVMALAEGARAILESTPRTAPVGPERLTERLTERLAERLRLLEQRNTLLSCLPTGRRPRLGVSFPLGQDFRHPLSGLRHIDEGLHGLELERGDRIGKALALGIDRPNPQTDRETLRRLAPAGMLHLPRAERLADLCWAYLHLDQVPVGIHLRQTLEQHLLDLAHKIPSAPKTLEQLLAAYQVASRTLTVEFLPLERTPHPPGHTDDSSAQALLQLDDSPIGQAALEWEARVCSALRTVVSQRVKHTGVTVDSGPCSSGKAGTQAERPPFGGLHATLEPVTVTLPALQSAWIRPESADSDEDDDDENRDDEDGDELDLDEDDDEFDEDHA